MRDHNLPILTLILLLAALLRLWGIDAQSLWIDEGFTVHLTQYGDPFKILPNDVHPPLYFLLVDAWADLGGISVLAMRYLSVLPGMLSVAVIYQVARELQIGRGLRPDAVPLLAALLLALADPEIFLAQEVRGYTLQVLLACLSAWGFLRWLRTSGRGWLVLWVLATAALVYTHYIGAFFGVAQGLYALVFLRGRLRVQAIAALIMSAALVAPWLLLTLAAQTGNLVYADWIRFTPQTLADLRTRWFTQMWPLTLGLALIGTIWRPAGADGKIRRFWRESVLLWLWLLLPLALTFAANEIIPLYQPRRVTVITPAVALLIAFGLGTLRGPGRALIVMALLVYGLTTVDFWRDKKPWRDFADQTAAYVDDLLLVEVGGDDYAPVYHYQARLPAEDAVTGLTTWRKLDPDTYEAGLPALIDAHDHIAFLYWGKDDSALAWLDELAYVRTAEIVADFDADVHFWRFDRLPDAPIAQYVNGLTLRDVALRPEDAQIDLFWSADTSLEHDYIVSAVLLDEAGGLVAQLDSQPFDNRRPTTTWAPGDVIYDPRPLNAPPGTYQAGVVVYRFTAEGDIQRLTLSDGADLLPLGDFTVSPSAADAAPDTP